MGGREDGEGKGRKDGDGRKDGVRRTGWRGGRTEREGRPGSKYWEGRGRERGSTGRKDGRKGGRGGEGVRENQGHICLWAYRMRAT